MYEGSTFASPLLVASSRCYAYSGGQAMEFERPPMKALLIVVTTVGVFAGGEALAQKMYWTDGLDGRLRRADLDGTNIEDLVIGAGRPVNIALDLANEKMFWADTVTDKIYRANLDGSGSETIITLGSPTPLLSEGYGLALDVADNKIYWTNEGHDNKIFRANLDGTDIVALVEIPNGNPFALALGPSGRRAYFSHGGDPRQKIQRADLEVGGVVRDLITNGLITPAGIALDIDLGKMYWTDASLGTIQRANLDGTSIETVVTNDLQFPWGIAIDDRNRKMYWAEANNRAIRRANLDGTDVETLVTDTGHALGIALDLRPIPEPTASNLFLIGLIAVFVYSRVVVRLYHRAMCDALRARREENCNVNPVGRVRHGN
jgi:sugar lactone lactonase YvrE